MYVYIMCLHEYVMLVCMHLCLYVYLVHACMYCSHVYITHANEALRLPRRWKTNVLERDIESTSIMLDTGTLRCIAHALKRQNFMCLASCVVRLGFSRRNTSHEHSCRTHATRHVRNRNTCPLCARSPSQAFAHHDGALAASHASKRSAHALGSPRRASRSS